MLFIKSLRATLLVFGLSSIYTPCLSQFNNTIPRPESLLEFFESPFSYQTHIAVHPADDLDGSRVIMLKLDSLIEFEIDPETNTFAADDKAEYHYDENNNIILLEEYYADFNGNYVPDVRIEVEYDTNHLITGRNYSLWNPQDGWYYSRRVESEYDAQSNIIFEQFLEWNTNLLSWSPLEKIDRTYSDNQVILDIEYVWSDEEMIWKFSRKKEYTYNSDNLLYERIEANWNEPLQEWEPLFIYQHTYNNELNTITIKRFFFSIELFSFVEDTRTIETYNDSGYLISSYFDYFILGWYPYSGYENTFDEFGNLVVTMYYYWDSFTEAYQIDEKKEYLFDLNYTADQLIMPGPLYGVVNKLDEYYRYEWDEEISSWTNKLYQHYYYSEAESSSFQDSKEINIEIFPNPCSKILNFNSNSGQVDEVRIYSAIGKLVKTATPKAITGNMDISALQTGLYTIQLQTPDCKIIQKFIKK
jgi:hypothetical protein